MLRPQRRSGAATAGVGIATALALVACCAGAPAIGALLGGTALGAALGLGLGALAVGTVACVGTVVVRRRRGRARRADGIGRR